MLVGTYSASIARHAGLVARDASPHSAIKDPGLYKQIDWPGFDPNGETRLDNLADNQPCWVKRGAIQTPAWSALGSEEP